MELKTIDFTNKHFECGGRKFTITETPSFRRYHEMQKISLEFGLSESFFNIYKNANHVYELLNQSKVADAAVALYNILYGIVSIEEKQPAAFRLCALFINEEGEDSAEYDEGKMNDKIECWGKELDPLPFFHLASSLVDGWVPAYNDFIQNGFPKMAQNEPIQ
jgi:hypothetical protein